MFRTSQICSLILMAVLLGVTVNAFAQKSAMPTGIWSGLLSSGKTARVRVEVNFQPNVAQIHFYGPFNCLIQASYVQSTGDGSIFTFKPSTSGGVFCDKLYPGNLSMNKTSQSGMALSLTNSGVHWSGTLKPGS